MKFHCCRRWRATSKPSQYGGVAKEGERRSAQEREVGGRSGHFAIGIGRVYVDVTWREVGGGIGSSGEE